MIDIDLNTEPNLQRLVNLSSFLVVFLFQEALENASPDYLIEKWNHWIGTEVRLTPNTIQPGDFIAFKDYKILWHLSDENAVKVKEIFYLIRSIDAIDIRNWIYWFRYFGGDIMKISSKKKTGLHPIAHNKVKDILSREAVYVTAFLREMKLNELLDEQNV